MKKLRLSSRVIVHSRIVVIVFFGLFQELVFFLARNESPLAFMCSFQGRNVLFSDRPEDYHQYPPRLFRYESETN